MAERAQKCGTRGVSPEPSRFELMAGRSNAQLAHPSHCRQRDEGGYTSHQGSHIPRSTPKRMRFALAKLLRQRSRNNGAQQPPAHAPWPPQPQQRTPASFPHPMPSQPSAAPSSPTPSSSAVVTVSQGFPNRPHLRAWPFSEAAVSFSSTHFGLRVRKSYAAHGSVGDAEAGCLTEASRRCDASAPRLPPLP